MVHGARCMVHGAWCMVLGVWCMAQYGTWCSMVHGAWCVVQLGAWCIVHGAWCVLERDARGQGGTVFPWPSLLVPAKPSATSNVCLRAISSTPSSPVQVPSILYRAPLWPRCLQAQHLTIHSGSR
ncbi:hypothetical protein E2C01_004584 [Portunus trituberculatus]|uniref:Uncharacterized protein n=1 Tax=Portunus trituberculatus TaxID=210409 RepID=A0A5B7CS50_PORTR|nr:hypothetical protein [Portunus trituberculatus]